MKEEGLLEKSNISFGHMLKLDNYREELTDIMETFLGRKHILLSNLINKGTLVILIKVYSQEVGLVKVNEIIRNIYEYLDETSQVEITNDIEENIGFRDYFNLTLIEV